VTTYYYDSSAGEGVDVYVIDTGVNIDHVEFQGRARWGKTMPENDRDEDNNGHGTHCAGTIASRKYGVAKKANVISVKVLRSNGSGTVADVLGGVVWASNEAARNAARARAEFAATGYTVHKGSVANMSLGGGKSRALEDTVNAAVEHGMHFAVAAGNDFGDACESSPAAAKNVSYGTSFLCHFADIRAQAITVGASTRDDERADFSNSGKCVDLFAPGLNILSTWIGTNYATNIISGTSMASPHTAGIVAYLLSLYSSNSTSVPSSQLPIPLSSLCSIITNEHPHFRLATVLNVIKQIIPRRITDSIMATYQAKPFVDTYQGGFDVAAVPGTLSPLQMKKLVIGMATADVLTDLPRDTPNLLIFNGAGTLPSSHALA
jgi:cerevisin